MLRARLLRGSVGRLGLVCSQDTRTFSGAGPSAVALELAGSILDALMIHFGASQGNTPAGVGGALFNCLARTASRNSVQVAPVLCFYEAPLACCPHPCAHPVHTQTTCAHPRPREVPCFVQFQSCAKRCWHRYPFKRRAVAAHPCGRKLSHTARKARPGASERRALQYKQLGAPCSGRAPWVPSLSTLQVSSAARRTECCSA